MPALQAARVGSSVFQGFNGRRHHHRTSCTSFALLDTFSKNAATSKPDPGTTSVSIPVTSTRRQLLSAAILSGTVLLQGTETASAKTTIASLKLGAQYERDIEVTASGIRMLEVSGGRGDPPTPRSLVMMDVVGSLEDGAVFLDTRGEGAAPLAFQLGTTNKYVTQGLAQVVETMRGGDVKLAVVPPELGYGSRGVTFKSGRRVPPDAALYYEISLLRCQTFPIGLACCSDADFPCVKNPDKDIDFMAGSTSSAAQKQ